jgi:hypothetical protein
MYSPPCLYTTPYEYLIVRSSTSGVTCTCHSVQQVCHFQFHLVGRLQMGSFQCTFRFGEQVKVTGG